MSEEEQETQAISDAREQLSLVLAAALGLANRALDHSERFAEIAAVRFDEQFDGGGFDWHVSAHVTGGTPFVHIEGHPHRNSNVFDSLQSLAKMLGNESAGFRFDAPVAWVRAAAKGAELIEQ